MRAILFILRNRVKSGWGGGSWLAVMDGAATSSAHLVVQWTPEVDEFDLPEARSPEPEARSSDRLLQMIVRDVDDIYLGQEPWDDPVRQVVCGPGAAPGMKDWHPVLYYSFVDRPPRPWFVENIIQKPAEHPQVGQRGGKMMLYR